MSPAGCVECRLEGCAADVTQPERARLFERHGANWMLAGNVVYATCQWGVVIILARTAKAEVVGQFAFAAALIAPVMFIASLRLKTVQATDAQRRFAFRDYLALRTVTTVAAVTVIIVAGLLLGDHAQNASVIVALGVAKGVESFSDLIYGLFQQHRDMYRIATSMIMRGVLGLGAFAAAVVLTGGLFWGILAMGASWLIVLLSHDVPAALRILQVSEAHWIPAGSLAGAEVPSHVWPQRTRMKELARLSLPLGLATTLISLNNNVPRYFVEHYLGAKALGVFAAVAYINTAAALIIDAFGQSASPRLAAYYAIGEHQQFQKLAAQLALVAASVGLLGICGACFAGEAILRIVYGDEYAEQSTVLICMMVAGMIGYFGSALGYAITATRHFGLFLVPYAKLSAIVVASSAALVPRFGLNGACSVAGIISLGTVVIPLSMWKRIR
jgi:O-antigen/teichoic acid export membrane protein